jgi:lipopolysaccharide heptosyltransferase II
MLPWNKRLLKTTDRLLGLLLRSFNKVIPPGCSEEPPKSRDAARACISYEHINRLLVIRPGGLGDAVLTFPMIQALGDYFTRANIDILAENRNAGIYTLHGRVNRIYRYDQNFFGQYMKLFRKRYDLIIDTEQFHHMSTLLAKSLKPSFLCGFESSLRSRFLTHSAHYDEGTYEARSFLHLAEAVNGKHLAFSSNATFVDIPADLKTWANRILGGIKSQPFVTFVPGATAKERQWPITRYRKIARWLTQKGYPVVVLGGKEDTETATTLARGFHPEEWMVNLTGQTTFSQTAAIIQKACAHVSSDTGVLHLACGVGTPTVSLFGPGLHQKWAPKGNQHVMIRTGRSCSPCSQQGEIPPCPHGAACIQEIETTTVKEGLKKVLQL